MLIKIHDKVRHVGTICRVAIVNLTDQIGPKRVEMSAKTGTNKKKMTQCFIFLLANKTKGTFCVSQLRNLSIQPKTSHQPNPTDGAHMSPFIMNLNQHHKTLLLLGCLPLPFDISTITVITHFIAAETGKIHKIRAERLHELEAPWLSKKHFL